MTVACPECRSKIPPDDVNLGTGLARCRACKTVFNAGANGTAGVRRRPETPLPKRWSLHDDGSRLVIEWRWVGPKAFVFLFFALMWNGFIFFWYSMAFGSNAPLIVFLFPLIHLAVGVGIGYAALAGLLNRTLLTVSPDSLEVRHGPLPWVGNKSLHPSRLAQVYCTEVWHRTKNGQTVSYSVHAMTDDSRKVDLVKRLDDQEQALYLEQEIERRLALDDRPVGGELPR
jgi:hypothetical protein